MNKSFLIGTLILLIIGCTYQIDSLNKSEQESEDTLMQKEVILTTDKTEYNQEETVIITLKNNLDESIFITPQYMPPIGIQERLDDRTWKALTLGPAPPPYMPPISRYVKINKNESHSYTWNQKIFDVNSGYFLQ